MTNKGKIIIFGIKHGAKSGANIFLNSLLGLLFCIACGMLPLILSALGGAIYGGIIAWRATKNDA
jgi:hypothetical protein